MIGGDFPEILEWSSQAISEYCSQEWTTPSANIAMKRKNSACCSRRTETPRVGTAYHELLKQREAEVAAYAKYRNLKDELFTLINPPGPLNRRESSVN